MSNRAIDALTDDGRARFARVARLDQRRDYLAHGVVCRVGEDHAAAAALAEVGIVAAVARRAEVVERGDEPRRERGERAARQRLA